MKTKTKAWVGVGALSALVAVGIAVVVGWFPSYFAAKYRSWHGSPSKQDGEIPFIVGHHAHSSAEICGRVDQAIDDSPGIAGLTPLLPPLQKRGG